MLFRHDAFNSDYSIALPYRSPLRYPGGKQKAISRIAMMLPHQ